MSNRTIGIVMSRLLTDEDLILRFAFDRVEALGELHTELFTNGLALTPSEIDLFIESDVQMWFWIDRRIADRTHSSRVLKNGVQHPIPLSVDDDGSSR